MKLYTNFKEKRIAKQKRFEKQVLQELSLNELKEVFNNCFGPFLNLNRLKVDNIETYGMDYAIEAFLLGASISKFGYYGESLEYVKERTALKEKKFVDALYCIIGEKIPYEEEVYFETLYRICKEYIKFWWNLGFDKGQKRYKLKLTR
ncbi:MAG: hypothetical protein K0S51_2263 [Bacillales bacterium]|jgi:hypothetical protein|nr:hypothetical protein [Bacillales bacterium]